MYLHLTGISETGNIRPHVVSLIFRSLVSCPSQAVDAAHVALRDVLSLSIVTKKSSEGEKSQSRLPKELLQTCIRPVLLHLRDFKRLSVPLLRGLSRLLSLLSSWFNKTLGEKLIDHLQKWTDPSGLIGHKIWKQGDEPLVAAAIVDIFASLPYAAHFVESLVKTCIKLEATLPMFKARFVVSPYRRPLARYLNTNPQSTAAFFFPRLKSPMYSELFLSLISFSESSELRAYLSNKQCSLMILNYCFEKPLAIIRSEKSPSTGSPTIKPLTLHGVQNRDGHVSMDHPGSSTPANHPKLRPMSTEAFELQHQGFRLVQILQTNDTSYFQEHNDIVRAFRWLWRSKGRFLRLQHEDMIPPRYHSESAMLACFLISYAKSQPTEDLDIFFELTRIFLQTSTSDFSFVKNFLADTVSKTLTVRQKKLLISRFFALVTGDNTEETKVLSIQYLILPMLQSSPDGEIARNDIVDSSVVGMFSTEVLHRDGVPTSCSVRLKVEFLKMLRTFIVVAKKAVEPYREELTRYCWGLTKTEDMVCRGWALSVISNISKTFDTPAKTVSQTFSLLLKSHQQEGKELVRSALKELVSVLPQRLDEEQLKRVMEQTVQLMLEDGNTTAQLAHICHTITESADIFFPNRTRFVGYLVSSINRLGLPPSSPIENRILSVDIVGLLLEWEEKEEASNKGIIPTDQRDSIGYFLVRLKTMLAEPTDARHQKVDQAFSSSLDYRMTGLLRRILGRWKVSVRSTPFDKAALKDQSSATLLLASLEVFTILAGTRNRVFFCSYKRVVKGVLLNCFRQARENEELRTGLDKFVDAAKKVEPLGPLIMNALETVLLEALAEMKRKPPGRSSDSENQTSSRSRDRLVSNDDSSSSALTEFTLCLLAKMCDAKKSHFKLVASTLLALATSLTKSHLSEAAAKQRQGSTSAPRMVSPGTLYHTRTSGILETIFQDEYNDGNRSSSSRPRTGKEPTAIKGGPKSIIRSLVVILSIFETSNLPFLFSASRKTHFQIISSLLDASDNVQVLVLATRIAGNWILSEDVDDFLTTKERDSLLRKISSLDYAGIQSDLQSQPLADTIGELVRRLLASPGRLKDADKGRFFVFMLLSADKGSRKEAWAWLSGDEKPSVGLFWKMLHADYESLGGRFWITILADALIQPIVNMPNSLLDAVRLLIYEDAFFCMEVFCLLFLSAWSYVETNAHRSTLTKIFEFLLSRPYHAQFIGIRDTQPDKRCSNAVRAFLNGVVQLDPVPVLDTRLLTSLAESYCCWYEVLGMLETRYAALNGTPQGENTLAAMRHCYKKLNEDGLWLGLAGSSCRNPFTVQTISKDVYGMVHQAVEGYSHLVDLYERDQLLGQTTDFELDLWEERWIELNKDLCQLQAVSEYANSTGSPHLLLEAAWKAQDWRKVKSLCSSAALLPSVESGDPLVKMSETLLAVAEKKLGEIENLHAQTAQLCLYKWQLLPGLCSGSQSHSSLLHFFHRLVEIRESGQIMVETSKHSGGRSLPDLKNLLSAWRNRLPNDWDRISTWDEIFAWRAHMFSAVTSSFHLSDPSTLATLHDRPWTAIRIAKTARKQGMRDVSLLQLGRTAEERSMNVSDAFLKLREQVLAYYNRDSDTERQGGINLINTTNLSFFDAPQKSELFRLKALFLASFSSRSKATHAFCHSVQVCRSHSRTWSSWGELCASLGAVAEKQADQSASGATNDVSKEAKANAAKKVSQYLAQAMGCFLEAVHLDGHEWARIHIPKCLWMLNKDGSSHGVLCQTLEDRGPSVPAWVWLPWIPQLLTSCYRHEGRAVKTLFFSMVKTYPQAVYYPLRSFYLERRDVERSRPTSSSPSQQQHMGSVAISENLMSLLRKSHAPLWGSLESVLEELIVRFRPSYLEELLSTLIALRERAESQVKGAAKIDDKEAVMAPVWKTLSRIAVKFFKSTDLKTTKNDDRAKKTAEFKAEYKESFERDFDVNADADPSAKSQEKPSFTLAELMERLGSWQEKLEKHVLSAPETSSLLETSHILAMFGVGDAPDLWPGSCDPRFREFLHSREVSHEEVSTSGSSPTSTSSSASAARKAANAAAITAATAAMREGVSGEYGGGSSFIEIPGQYAPNTCAWADVRPSPELHAKLIKFDPSIDVLRRNDQLVRRIGMVASDGCTYRFLLQFAVPYWTRTDERTTQLHYILDKAIRKDFGCLRATLSAQPQPVIPVAQRLRLTYEPEGRVLMDTIYRQYCEKQGLDHSALVQSHREATKELSTIIPPPPPSPTSPRLKLSSTTSSTSSENEGDRSKRMEIFRELLASPGAEATILSDYQFSFFSHSPEALYQFRRTFTQQWGANCFLQYVFCVSDRSPGRVAWLTTNGRVLSPEFRIAYNNQGFAEASQVPFRLTPNLVHTMGLVFLDSTFVPSIGRLAGTVRSNRADLDSIFRLLLRDDLVTFYTKSTAKSDTQTQEMEKQLVDRVSRNVAAVHHRCGECSPIRIATSSSEKEEPTPVDQKVRELVLSARSAEQLSLMPSTFQGWL